MLGILETTSRVIWGPLLLIPLLLLTGLYLTFLLRGLQFRRLGYALWLGLIRRQELHAEGDISHYQALTTALAATVGVGNIAGVATAIFLGGPGAVLWMWATGLVGMATKYCEAFLGVRFRRVDGAGEQSGGPQFYLGAAIRGPLGGVLGVGFAVAPYRIAFVLAIFFGAVTELELVWTFSDVMNGLMALPNLIGLLLLSGMVARETRAFFARPGWREVP